MKPLVEVEKLVIEATSDSGRSTRILDGISLAVAPGEMLALIGESGSGKTTLALALMAHARRGCRFCGGAVKIGGRDILALDAGERRRLRGAEVAYVPQSAAAAFNPSRRILEQVVEIAAIHGLASPAEARARACALFRALSLPEPETIGERYPHQVSGGQLQRLAAAMALIGRPKLVIFDEPTTALDVTTQIEALRAFKSAMASGGMAGVYVSHDLAVVAQIADRIMVLKGGAAQEEGTTRQILEAPQHPYTRSLIDAFAPQPRRPSSPDAETSEPARPPVLEACNLVAAHGRIRRGRRPAKLALDDVSFVLPRGRNLGVIGESGSGKSTLALALAGLLRPCEGAVLLNGRELEPEVRWRSKDQLRRIQIVFQLADTALNPAVCVGDILGRPLTFYHDHRGAERERRIDKLLDQVRLPRGFRHRLPGELSGGQKQRVNLARALAAEPDVILCDEVTSALDTVVAAAVIELLKDLQRSLDLSYVFISHDLKTVQAICDEVLVMHRGVAVERLYADELPDGARHEYSRQLFASTPQLDPTWLDRVRPA